MTSDRKKGLTTCIDCGVDFLRRRSSHSNYCEECTDAWRVRWDAESS